MRLAFPRLPRGAVLLLLPVVGGEPCVSWSSTERTLFVDEHEPAGEAPYCRTACGDATCAEECLVASPRCDVWWRYPGADAGPRRRGGATFGQCALGPAILDGGGNFDILQARRREGGAEDCGDKAAAAAELRPASALDGGDYALLAAATGGAFPGRGFLDLLVDASTACDLRDVLSPSRYVPHALDGAGLHAFRALLAERLRDARLAHYAPPGSGAVLDEWRRDGVILRDFDAIGGDAGLRDLLAVVAGEPGGRAGAALRLGRAQRLRDGRRPQSAAHIDSFASVVKVWLFDAAGAKPRPLAVAVGSQRHTVDRLAWLHAYATGGDEARRAVPPPGSPASRRGVRNTPGMAANVAYGAPAKKAKVDGKVSPQTEEAPKTVSVVGPYGLLTSKTRGHLGCDAAKLREARIDMAACYRIMDELGLNEGIDNHLTVMPKASALCCLEDMEIKMIHQNSCRFLDEVAYDTVYEGLVLGKAEGDRLAEVMGSKRVLMHQSHGPITCGDSVAEAFDEIYYLERACEVQPRDEHGKPTVTIKDSVARFYKDQVDQFRGCWAQGHFEARKRALYKPKGLGNADFAS
ncbi:hypothetical protein JL720_8509 [Aureococcus anophagefferens]|nr:hypothetical protein JL720_8509 [Aureococcus anophagefferens]